MYTKEYDSILKTEDEISKLGFFVGNNVLKSVDINTIAHFGNLTCLELWCEDVSIMSGYNNTQNLGYLIKALIEILDICEEDGLRLSKIKNIPIRIVTDSKGWGGKCIGFGHFMQDRFVITEDFVKIRPVA
jgi:hypothetical protein